VSWPVVTLDEVATINPRLPKGKVLPEDVSFLPMAAVSEQGEVLSQELRPLADVRKGFTYFERGDVLLAKITPCFENGKAAFLDDLDTDVGFGSTEFHVVRPNADALDGKFLFYLLWNAKFRHEGERNMTGSAGQRRVPTGFLERYTFPLPPLETQKHIVRVLEQADQLRKEAQQMERELNQLAQSLFLEMFGDPVLNQKEWTTKPLVEIAKLARGRFSARPRNDPQFYGGPHPFIQTGTVVSSDSYITTHDQTLNDKGLAVSKMFPPGTIAITIAANIGATAILTYPMCFPDSVVGITAGPKVCVEFLEYQLRIFKQRLEGDATETAQKNINLQVLEPLEVIVPPLELQRRFTESFKAIYAQLEILNHWKNEADNSFNSLMQRAFNGELTAPGSKAA
jgi:type I restriction enzyme S subunit